MDGQVFPVNKMQAGSTAPPFHPWCRCTTAPYYEDMVGVGQRFARDADGKTYTVPSDMTYAEWKEKAAKMAADNVSENNCNGAITRNVTQAEKEEIIDYAKQKGINVGDLSKFDGDSDLLKAEIDTLAKLNTRFLTNNKKLTISVGHLSDSDFAETKGNTIIFNTKVLRNREITEKNIRLVKGEFASQKLEDIAAHEFGHIFSAKKGNIGIDISRKAHYNIFGEDITVNEMLEYLDSEISQYSTTYYENGNNRKHKFDVKRYREVIPEIFARDNSCPNDFTEEFVKLLKEV